MTRTCLSAGRFSQNIFSKVLNIRLVSIARRRKFSEAGYKKKTSGGDVLKNTCALAALRESDSMNRRVRFYF
jgi:hypothetical protein